MHIPTTSVNLKDRKYSQICLGIQGPPGTFKTGSALTFPNVTVYDIDNGLTSYAGRELTVLPICDYEWACSYANGLFKPKRPEHPPNRMGIIEHLLVNEALKMTSEQTLVLDSWSSLQDAFEEEMRLPHQVIKRMTKSGEEDTFKYWAEKITYSKRILTLCRSLKCHVVIPFHEIQVRNPDTGQLMDKVAPLMQGKFVAELKRFFTDWFRSTSEERKDPKGKVISTEFFWQVRSDNQFDAKSRLVFPDGVYKVEPNFKIFEQYGYKTS